MKDTFDDEEGGEEWEKAEKYHHHRHGYQKWDEEVEGEEKDWVVVWRILLPYYYWRSW
jgi:hypothetical protein